jgi:hypothetical protein
MEVSVLGASFLILLESTWQQKEYEEREQDVG